MSKIALTPNASGTGTISLVAPNTSTDRTITLPDETGSIITTGSSGQVIPSAALPIGSVLQVVYGWTNTSSSTSSNSMQDTGLTATITPSSTSNKILILISQQMYLGTDNGVQLQLMRDSTTLWYSANSIHTQSAGANWQSHPHNHYDSPSTTSAVTYKTQYCSRDNGETVGVQGNNYLSTITLMEIAA